MRLSVLYQALSISSGTFDIEFVKIPHYFLPHVQIMHINIQNRRLASKTDWK